MTGDERVLQKLVEVVERPEPATATGAAQAAE